MKLILAFLLFIIPASYIQAQLKTETITIDFKNLPASNLKAKAKRGSMVILEIKNINRSQYNVQVNNSQTNFFTSEPQIFTRISTTGADIEKEEVGIQTPASSFAGGSAQNEISEEIDDLNKKQIIFNAYLKEFENGFEEYKKAITVLKNSILLGNVLTTISEDCSRDFAEILADAKTQAAAFVNANKILNETPGVSESVLKGQINNILAHYYKQASDKYNELKILQAKINEAAANLSESIPKLDKKIDEQLLSKKITADKRKPYESAKLIVGKINRTAKKDADNVNELMKVVEKAENFRENYASTNQAGQVIIRYSKFNEKFFSVRAAEIIEKDELLFDVTIQPKSSEVCTGEILHFPIKVRSKEGFKIDFSSGLFLNFGNNDFFDQTYRLDSVANEPDKYKIVKNANRNKIIPSIGALLHAYIRTGGDIQPALSLGLSLSAGDDSRLNYHFGASVIIGKQQRLVASFGWTLAQSEVLDGNYSEGQMLLKEEAPQTVPTTRYYRWGNFFSLNYNLTP